LFERGANITESAQYDDEESDRFFMRVAFTVDSANETSESLSSAFASIAKDLHMESSFYSDSTKTRVLLLASQWTHCLADLLHRHSSGELEVEIVGVASNHLGDAQRLAREYGIPFEHLDTKNIDKPAIEEHLLAIMRDRQVGLTVLARYMQILSEHLCLNSPCPIINIHHSFLPGFKGARPYHQAFARGVKIVGATAHYVTADLDEGPIIEQDVARVNHAMDAKGMMEIGRDLEKSVLARAVKLHVRHRVLPNGPRTVVFA
jgi:formyltetrahydrofolate deformylase